MLPTIVLLPGMDGTGELFQPFLAALKGGFRTIIVRYPAETTLTYPQLASLAASQLPSETPFVVLAESFSGPIAISLAASKPAGLVGLILCATFARYSRPSLRYLIPILGLVPKNRIPSFLINFFFLGRFSDTQIADDLQRVFKNLNDTVLAQRLRLILAVDVVFDLKRIDVPLLYLMATKDRLIPHSAAEPFEKLSQCQIRKLNGPHLLLQSSPEDAASVVEVFLNSLVKGDR